VRVVIFVFGLHRPLRRRVAATSNCGELADYSSESALRFQRWLVSRGSRRENIESSEGKGVNGEIERALERRRGGHANDTAVHRAEPIPGND